MWMLYLAIEPWIRRRWPHAIISWSRLISGQLRDPLVGRDILLGVTFGAVWILIFEFPIFLSPDMGAAPPLEFDCLSAGRASALGQWLMQIPSSIFGTLEFFFLLLGLKVLLVARNGFAPTIAFVALFVGLRSLQSTHLAVDVPALCWSMASWS